MSPMRTLAELIPLRTAACRDAEAVIVSIAAGDEDVDPEAGCHVASCLRCQAEVVAYRRVMTVMRSLRSDLRWRPRKELGAADGTPAGRWRPSRPGPCGPPTSAA